MDTIVVLIGGGHAAGKRTAAHLLRDTAIEALPDLSLDIKIIDMEKYVDAPQAEIPYADPNDIAITVNTDRELAKPQLKPSRYRFDALRNDILREKSQQSIVQKILIVHGLYALYDKQLRQMANLKVFISGDSDTRLINWIKRDVVNGEKSLQDVICRYIQGARDEMNDFIFPTKEFSDVILPSVPEQNAISLLVDGIMPYIDAQEKGYHLRAAASVLGARYEENKTSFYELN